ncbi:MAG: DUF58 domain-containing protein [Xanthomonadaceae bacterium]|nr:DUF58 domain-containing protein [Xanthomonadaceae bacterium]
MILPDELMKKVRRIEFSTRKLVSDVLMGKYRTSFKGQGVQFSEHREYMVGDDVRHIDWKTSARTRDPLIKKFEEERELTVLMLIDVSGSKEFGSRSVLKSEMAAEIAGMIAAAAIQTGDKVGAMLFSSEVEKIIRPGKGQAHILRLIREVLGFEPKKRGTNLEAGLTAAARMMKHSGIVFVISDFQSTKYDIALRRLAKKNDVVAVWLRDPGETEIPVGVPVLVQDPESGRELWIHSGSYEFKKWFSDFKKNWETEVRASTRSGKVDMWELNTGEDYAESLARYFQFRSSRK